MKNIDFIKSMSEEQLTNFLWIWGINTTTLFMTSGGMEVMNIPQLREWLEKENFECKQTHVPSDMTFNSDYIAKGE